MSIISNLKIYDFEESLKASGYPMRTEIDSDPLTENDYKRGLNLVKAAANDNPAHGQWLTGVRVAFDITFTVKAWTEAERYRFLEFVSSQSTMHRMTRFDLSKSFIEYTDERIIVILKEKIDRYNQLSSEHEWAAENKAEMDRLYLEILYSCPVGLKLTARLTTNYRCLLNIYNQRYNHRLPEWREFCNELLELPHFKEW